MALDVHVLDEDGEDIDIKNGFDTDDFDVLPAVDSDIEFENVNDATYDNGFILDNEDGSELDEDDDSDFYTAMGVDFDSDPMDEEEDY